MTFLISSYSNDFDTETASTNTQVAIIPNIGDRLFYFPTKVVNGETVPNYSASPSTYTPHLATSWKRINRKTWVFTLRKGVKGCTGDPFTSADVVYTFARAKARAGTVNQEFRWFANNGLFNSADTSKTLNGAVKALGKYKVKFTLPKPNTLFPLAMTDEAFANILDSKLLKAHATASDPWATKWFGAGHSASFGPYCLASVNDSAQQINLRANPGWYGQVQFKKVTVRAVTDDSSRFAAVQSGAANGTTELSPQEYASLRKSASVYSFPDSGVNWMGFNSKIAPWSLPKSIWLRRAVQAALPYKTIIKALQGSAALTGSIIPARYNGSIPFKAPQTNLALAKADLAKAGFPGGSGLSQYQSGLTIDWSASNQFLQPVINQIVSALNQIGIPVTTQMLTTNQFTSENFGQHALPMMVYSLNPGDMPDAGAAAQLFFADATAGGVANFTNFSNQQVDTFAQSYASGSQNQYKADVAQMLRAINSGLPVIPISSQDSQMVFSKGIYGEEIHTIGITPTFWTLRTK